jgi:hypothetical protein
MPVGLSLCSASRPAAQFIATKFDDAGRHSNGVVGEPGGWMKRRSRDKKREQRITMEIVVDAYTPEEQAMGWYYSLEDRLHFPFVARYITGRSISPLRVGDGVEVVGMAPEEECQHEMFVPDPLGTPSPGGSPGPAGGRRVSSQDAVRGASYVREERSVGFG